MEDRALGLRGILVTLEVTWLVLCVIGWLLFGLVAAGLVSAFAEGCESCDSGGEVFFDISLDALRIFAVGAVLIGLLTVLGWALVREVRRIWFSQSG
jgi:hypothetical protein